MPATKILPIADRTPCPLDAPDQLPRTRPSLACTAVTAPPVCERHVASPADSTNCGAAAGSVVSPKAVASLVVQFWRCEARRLAFRRAVSTVRERNAAIWRRVTGLEGSYVVGVVPVVIPV